MAYSNGIITAPVSIRDVQNALGSSLTDIGSLIRNGNINKWARYKPVVKNQIDTVTGQINTTTNAWLPTATWWKGTSGTCGFDSVSVLMDTPSAIAYNSIYSGGMWNYQKPYGGANSPYRLTDFAGYNHNAVCPFKIDAPSSFTVGYSGVVRVYFDEQVFGFQSAGNLSLGNLINLSTYNLWRPTLAIVNPDNDSVVRYFFSQSRLQDAPSMGYEIGLNGLSNILTPNKTYIGVVMLSNYDTDQYGNVPSEGVASEWSGAQAVSCSFENGIDCFSAKYQQGGYIPGGDPSTDNGTWYYTKFMELDGIGITDEASQFNIGGLEFWIQPRVNGVPNKDYISPSNMEFKLTAVIHDGYDYDDSSSGGTYNANNLYSTKELLIVNWTRCVVGTNIDWDSYDNAYVLELGNYIYQGTNGNVHNVLYLDKDSFPHDVRFKLYMRYAGAEYTVLSANMTLANSNSYVVINNGSL